MLILIGLLALCNDNIQANTACKEQELMQAPLDTYSLSIAFYSANNYKKISHEQIIKIDIDKLSETMIIIKYDQKYNIKKRKLKNKIKKNDCNNYFIFIKNLLDNNIMILTSPKMTVIGGNAIAIEIRNNKQSNAIGLQPGDMNESIEVIYNLIVDFLKIYHIRPIS